MSLQSPSSHKTNKPNRQDDLKVWSCVNCRRRKVRCDRRHPCSPCTRNKSDCVFPVSGRIPRRGGRDANYPKPPAQKQVELLGRLRRLEAMIGDLGSQVENAASKGDLETSTGATSSEIAGGIASGSQPVRVNQHPGDDGIQAISGMMSNTSDALKISDGFDDMVVASNGDLVVGNQFWTVFCKEVEQIFQVANGPTVMQFDHDSSPSTMPIPDNQHHHSYYNFLLRNTSAGLPRNNLHPLPSQLLFLWQMYIDNVDPFFKILHVPTMTKVIRELKGSYQSLSHSMQALVLIISYAAIISLDPEEVRMNFNTEKNELANCYRLGAEQALEKAEFFNNPEIPIVQALTIYLGVLQHAGETKSAWILAGTLVRIAVSMKLHQDGSNLTGMLPFEVELRRRLWWKICLIDSRSDDMQVFGFKISERLFNTEIPTSVDDSDLYPRMSSPPVLVDKWTDMTVFLVRCETWKLSRQLQSVPAAGIAWHSDIDKKFALLNQSRTRIEDFYLKHVDSTQPLHVFVATNARLFLAKVDFILHAKKYSVTVTELQPTQPSRSDKEFFLSLSIIEYTYALQNEPSWKSWSWQIQGREPPWIALKIVFSQLCTRHWEPIFERAWSSAKMSFDNIPEALLGCRFYQRLLELVSAVQLCWADKLQNQGGQTPETSIANGSDVSAIATSATLPISLAQICINGSVLTSNVENGYNETFHNDDFNFEMDWQNWDEDPRGSGFWDINNF